MRLTIWTIRSKHSMATKSRGYVDAYHQSRVNHLTGTAYPTALTGTWIGLYLGSLPVSDGTGTTDIVRVAVTLDNLGQDGNTGRWYVQPTAAVAFTIPATVAGEVVGWGVYGAASGGTPVYVDAVASPFPVKAGQVITIPAQELRVWAEGAM
jgi:hypothetical protein